MMIDERTRRELAQAVRQAVRDAIDGNDERWLTGRQLCEQFGMFTPSWLKEYGHLLGRQRATVRDPDGTVHQTGWAYPRNRIQRMLRMGELEFLIGDASSYVRTESTKSRRPYNLPPDAKNALSGAGNAEKRALPKESAMALPPEDGAGN